MQRNDPCLCGSGKTYNQCCGLKDEMSNEEFVQEEVEQILHGFLENPLENYTDMEELQQYEREWLHKLKKLVGEDFLNELLPNYFLFIARQDLWKRYVVKMLNRSIRAGTKNVLAMWQDSFVLFGRITEVTSEAFKVSELLGHKTYTAKRNEMTLKEGGLVIGIAFPDTRDYGDGITLMNAQTIVPEATEEIADKISAMAKESGESTSHMFFTKYMADVYKVLFEWRPDGEVYDSPEKELTSQELGVLTSLDKVLTINDVHEEDIVLAQKIALLYLQGEPNFRKAAVIAAASVYITQEYHLFEVSRVNYTQTEVASMFDVSVSSMVSHADAIEDILVTLFIEFD